MMSTIDGKIASGTGVDILENYFELYTKTEDELGSKAWMCGRVTMEMFASGVDILLPSASAHPGRDDFIATTLKYGYFIGLDTRGKLRWDKNAIKLTNVPNELPLVIVVTAKTPKEYLAYLREKNISYLFGGENKLNFPQLFEKIRARLGIKKLLLEDGGLINGSVLAADLIDEISLLVAPIVLNRTRAPATFERKTNEINIKKFSLVEDRKLEKDTVWLRYKRNRH